MTPRQALGLRFTFPGLLLSLLGLVACGGGQPTVAVGTPSPDFSLPTLDGGTVRLESLAGRPAVIAFWATWCQPCLAEIPVLNALAEDERVAILSIALDEGGRPPVERFVEARGIRYPVALGNAETFSRFDGFAIPYTIVLDEAGTIVSLYRGPADQETLERDLGLPTTAAVYRDGSQGASQEERSGNG